MKTLLLASLLLAIAPATCAPGGAGDPNPQSASPQAELVGVIDCYAAVGLNACDLSTVSRFDCATTITFETPDGGHVDKLSVIVAWGFAQDVSTCASLYVESLPSSIGYSPAPVPCGFIGNYSTAEVQADPNYCPASAAFFARVEEVEQP